MVLKLEIKKIQIYLFTISFSRCLCNNNKVSCVFFLTFVKGIYCSILVICQEMIIFTLNPPSI